MAKTRKTTGSATSGADSPSQKKADGNIKGNKNSPAKGNGGVNGNGNGDCGNGKIRCKSLVIDGTKYRTRLNQKFEGRKSWEYPDPNKIFSQIPGTIIRVDVKVGQEVEAGEQMLILEAMKMKNKILFHTGGTVKSIHVKEGEKIPKGYLMVELK